MNVETVKRIVREARKGANIRLAWYRSCKTKKNCTDTITKAVHTVGRIGIDYNNQKVVQEKRENGDLPETPQPIWNGKGLWEEFPYMIKHVNTGQHYLRLYKGSNNAKHKTVQYFRNGRNVEFSDVENDLLASEKKASHDSDCFTCKVEDLTDISWG